MQWQKLKNVNPPFDETLMVCTYVNEFRRNHVYFAKRIKIDDNDSFIFHEDFSEVNYRQENVFYNTFEEFKRDFGESYWCLFKSPGE